MALSAHDSQPRLTQVLHERRTEPRGYLLCDALMSCGITVRACLTDPAAEHSDGFLPVQILREEYPPVSCRIGIVDSPCFLLALLPIHAEPPIAIDVAFRAVCR